MSLFPAYAAEGTENAMEYEVSLAEISSASPALEAQLLASDNDEERHPPARSLCSSVSRDCPLDTDDFYLDRKFDAGNLRVSTLYYPGRPQYERRKSEAEPREGRRARRYWQAGAGAGADERGGHDAAELAQRSAAYRDMLAQRPHDAQLWLTYIDFLERCGEEGGALAAAERARDAAGGSARLRAAAHRLRADLPPQRRRDLLRADVAAANSPELKLEAWLRLLEEVARTGSGAELERAAGEALGALRAHAPAYPHVLYLYGGALRAAGLWERLVLLVELALAVNVAPECFPPAGPPRSDDALLRAEDEVVASGLPLSALWVRVERARGAAHWRPAPPPPPAADPQRAPLPADVADLVQPARGAHAQLLLLVQALRLAKVPVLPAAQYAQRALQPALDAGDAWSCAGGEALLPLLRAARRLPAAHPARPAQPAAARGALAHFLDPPHYFTDEHGFEAWVRALWEGGLARAGGEARAALLCWRLRWLHARATLHDAPAARRLRAEARAALKRWAPHDPLAYAHFARLELAAAGPPHARRVALQAARAALQSTASPAARRLYVARVLAELDARAGLWATACAALARALPADELLATAPPPDLIDEALLECERECTELEARLGAGGAGAGREAGAGAGRDADEASAAWVRAMLPHAAEWGAARARLAPPRRRAELLAHVRRAADADLEEDALRYWEQSACALAAAAARDHAAVTCARALAPLFPHNALLALACGGAPLWAGRGEAAAPVAPGRTHAGALALVLPALLRAAPRWEAQDAARLAAGCARAARGGAGGALLHALRLEAEARAPRPRAHAALLAALDALPNHKWLYVRGAAWCGAQAAALADALLERGLRLHALRDELAPLDELTPFDAGPSRAQ